MTLNQIAYWSLKETERSNKVREEETNRHNVVTEIESERHNKATEANQYLSAMAAQSSAAAAHRQASVAETRVRNDYELGLMNVEVNKYKAETDRINATTNQFNAVTNRTNAETKQGELVLKNDQFLYGQATTGWYDVETNPYAPTNKGGIYDNNRYKVSWVNEQIGRLSGAISDWMGAAAKFQ